MCVSTWVEVGNSRGSGIFEPGQSEGSICIAEWKAE